jgi:hypothetical protein
VRVSVIGIPRSPREIEAVAALAVQRARYRNLETPRVVRVWCDDEGVPTDVEARSSTCTTHVPALDLEAYGGPIA